MVNPMAEPARVITPSMADASKFKQTLDEVAIVTVNAVTPVLDRESNITLSAAVGTDAPAVPPELVAQLVV